MGILRQTTNVMLSNKLIKIQHYMGSGFLSINSLSQEEISFNEKKTVYHYKRNHLYMPWNIPP